MSRNNEERFGAAEASLPPPVMQPETATSEQTFSFVVPTEFVELPSKGWFYPEDHPLHNQESIEIRYMTAKDEDTLTSSALLKKGIALDRLLQNVIVDKRIQVDDLLVGDKNAILVASRISGYGRAYDVKMTCSTCFETSEYQFDLAELNMSYDSDLEENGVTLLSNNTFLLTLPRTNVEVALRLITGADEKALTRLAQKRKKSNLPESVLR